MASSTVETKNVPVTVMQEQKRVILNLSTEEAEWLSAYLASTVVGGHSVLRPILIEGDGSILHSLQKSTGKKLGITKNQQELRPYRHVQTVDISDVELSPYI